MNYFSPIAALLLGVLSATSCTPTQQKEEEQTGGTDTTSVPVPPPPPMPQYSPKVVSIEHRYSNAQRCRDEAQAYYKSTGATGVAPTVSTSPLIYSFPEPTPTPTTKAKREIRFIMQPTGTTQPTNTVIAYYLVKIKTSDHKKDLQAAYDDLKKKKCKGLQPPIQDRDTINGKIPVRALMSTAAPVDEPDKTFTVDKADSTANKAVIPTGKYGIIINPPYP